MLWQIDDDVEAAVLDLSTSMHAGARACTADISNSRHGNLNADTMDVSGSGVLIPLILLPCGCLGCSDLVTAFMNRMYGTGRAFPKGAASVARDRVAIVHACTARKTTSATNEDRESIPCVPYPVTC